MNPIDCNCGHWCTAHAIQIERCGALESRLSALVGELEKTKSELRKMCLYQQGEDAERGKAIMERDALKAKLEKAVEGLRKLKTSARSYREEGAIDKILSALGEKEVRP